MAKKGDQNDTKSLHEEVTRSVRLPKEIWDKLDNDAKRCCRSASKQIEALLTSWYQFGNVNIFFEETQVRVSSNINSQTKNQAKNR